MKTKKLGTEKNLIPSKDGDSSEITAVMLAEAFEKKELQPEKFQTRLKIECVGIYKAKGYTYPQIANLIHTSERTAMRYMEVVKRNNAVMLAPDFQRETIGDAVRCMDVQSDRLLRLSQGGSLSISEQARMIVAACQIRKYKIDFLSEHGYLNREFTEEIQNENKQKIGKDPVWEAYWKIPHEKRRSFLNSMRREEKEMQERFKKITEDFLKQDSNNGTSENKDAA